MIFLVPEATFEVQAIVVEASDWSAGRLPGVAGATIVKVPGLPLTASSAISLKVMVTVESSVLVRYCQSCKSSDQRYQYQNFD